MIMSSDTFASKFYQENGFWMSDSLFDSSVMDQVDDAIDELIDLCDTTDLVPKDNKNSGNFDPSKNTRVIEMPHLFNDVIYDFITDSELSKVLASVVGAKKLQIWGAQLFHKPPGPFKGCNIGWHQDYYFNKRYWAEKSELFTAWIAVSDVEEHCGPVRYVPGSHKWGFVDIQSCPKEYFISNLNIPSGEDWQEIPAVLAKGALVIHDKYTIHGSYSNLSNVPRRSIVIRFCTENSELLNKDHENMFVDPRSYPVTVCNS